MSNVNNKTAPCSYSVLGGVWNCGPWLSRVNYVETSGLVTAAGAGVPPDR